MCSDEGFSNIIIFTTTGAIVLVYLCAKIRKLVFEKWSTKEEEDQAMEVGCGKVDCREILNEFESQYEDDDVILKVNNYLIHILYSKTVEERKIIFRRFFMVITKVQEFDEQKVYNFLLHNIEPKLVDEMLESQYPGITARIIDFIENLIGIRFIRNTQDMFTENDDLNHSFSISKRIIKLVTKSIHKIKDICIVVMILVAVGGPSGVVNFITKFTSVTVVVLFLLIIVPDLMSSLHLAVHNPGMIFRQKDRKFKGLKLCLLQAVNILSFLINEILLTDDYEVAKGKLIIAAKKHCPEEIQKRLRYYHKTQRQRRDFVKINYETGVYYMIVAHLCLLNLGRTETPTTGGLVAVLHRKTTILGLEIYPKTLLNLSILWSLFSSIRVRLFSISSKKQFFPLKSQCLAFCWILFGSLRKTLMMLVFFVPSFGFYDILHHWKMEQIPFKSRINYAEKFGIYSEDRLELNGLNQTIYWRDLDRWDYSDPKYPRPPHYNNYTGLTLQETFGAFLLLLVLHFIAIFVAKLKTARDFSGSYNKLEKCFHVLENMNIPETYIDWDVTPLGSFSPFRSMRSSGNHWKQFRFKINTFMNFRMTIFYRSVNIEMGLVFGINFIFNALLLLPLTYTVTKINDRHDFLAKLVTTKSKEDESYETVNILLVGVTICFIIFSILEMAFYYIYNYWVSFYLLYMYLLNRNDLYFLSL